MTDQDKTRQQLIDELAQLRGRVTELDATRRMLTTGRPIGVRGFPMAFPCGKHADVHPHSRSEPMHPFCQSYRLWVTPDQIIGKNLCDFCPPEDREKVRECIQRVFRTGKPGLHEGPAYGWTMKNTGMHRTLDRSSQTAKSLPSPSSR